MKRSFLAVIVAVMLWSPVNAELPGEGPRLGTDRLTQAEIESGSMTLREIRQAGLKMFTTPFNREDGYGDGPMNPDNTVDPGGRPTLQNNGVFLRVNGLDGQTCLECHSIVSNATVPATLGVGGVGGSVTNAIFQPTVLDVSDSLELGFAFTDGRFINPPFLFGSGGVELVGREMTAELQALKVQAQSNPGIPVSLDTKGVNFGELVYENGAFDTSGVEGIDTDLVVRPFGRKGEFATVRGFDEGAMRFHFGMEPVESVGADIDGDGDGVANEVMIGEMSALVIFNTTLEHPVRKRGDQEAEKGFGVFNLIGCDSCHEPSLVSDSRLLRYQFPENPLDADDNVFYEVDLARAPAGFPRARSGGIEVPLFADLKRHDMGPGLAESFGHPLDAEFTTARLWGVADTAPYMHDGRALTLVEAILMHGGEAQEARDGFAALGERDQARLLTFLRSLRTPKNPLSDL